MPQRIRQRSVAVRAAAVTGLIQTIRGVRVILSQDLATVYGVSTKALNQAVKRNRARFPRDFAFRLSLREASVARRLRSQIVTLKQGSHVKYAPMAFSEHGAIMAASVLNSTRAVAMSIFVVRAFLRLRDLSSGGSELWHRLAQLERRVGAHDHELKAVIAAIRQLLHHPEPARRRIGFHTGRL